MYKGLYRYLDCGCLFSALVQAYSCTQTQFACRWCQCALICCVVHTKQVFAYSILVTGSEIRSCERISLFHHHQSRRPISSQQAFDKTLRSPFSCWLDEKAGGEITARDGSGEVRMTDQHHLCPKFECLNTFYCVQCTEVYRKQSKTATCWCINKS